MKVRDYAKQVGFEVIGRLRYMGKWDLCTRCYEDEGKNLFLVDDIVGVFRIIPKKKKPAGLTTDLI